MNGFFFQEAKNFFFKNLLVPKERIDSNLFRQNAYAQKKIVNGLEVRQRSNFDKNPIQHLKISKCSLDLNRLENLLQKRIRFMFQLCLGCDT